ncbi:MAG: hypothetical protein ACM3N9_00955, partial [Syntrophothermus sp.]
MSEGTPTIRLSKAAREFNIGVTTIVDFLSKKGHTIEKDPNSKLSQEMYSLLLKEFSTDKHVKDEAKKIGMQFSQHETITIDDKKTAARDKERERDDLIIKNVNIAYDKKPFEQPKKPKPAPVPEEPKVKAAPPAEPEIIVEEKPAPEPVVAEKPAAEVPAEVIPATPPVPEPVIEEPVAEQEEPAKQEEEVKETRSGDLKVYGKIDVDAFKKPKKSKHHPEKKEVKEEAEPVLAAPAETEPAPAPIPVAEVPEPEPVTQVLPEPEPVVEEETPAA